MQLSPFNQDEPINATFVGRSQELAALFTWSVETPATPAYISGLGGIGKTSLVRAFLSSLSIDTAYISLGDETDPRAAIDSVLRRSESRSPPDRRLVIAVDDTDLTSEQDLWHALGEYLPKKWPRARGLAIARRPPTFGPWRSVAVAGLDEEDVSTLLRRMTGFAPATIADLAAATNGNPLAARLVGSQLQTSSPEAVAELLGRFTWDERSLLTEVRSPAQASQLDIQVQAVSDALIRRLKTEPQLLYQLRPRQFEELMAELYSREGFEVELTPETRDGGVDLYVVQHTAFGRLLTVVDCKRKAKGSPVGVAVVRQMLGTIETVGASAGVLATTSRYTKGAVELGARYPFRLGLQDYFDLHDMLVRANPTA